MKEPDLRSKREVIFNNHHLLEKDETEDGIPRLDAGLFSHKEVDLQGYQETHLSGHTTRGGAIVTSFPAHPLT